jgi:hypothetical protein
MDWIGCELFPVEKAPQLFHKIVLDVREKRWIGSDRMRMVNYFL